MKSKVVLILSLLIFLWFFAPVIISSEGSVLAANEVRAINNDQNESQLVNEQEESLSQQEIKPLKNYFLILLPNGSRQSIKINPPATRISVISESGNTAVRCGDRLQNYSCIPGQRLELAYEEDIPIEQFWGENQSETQVRLRIEVYQQIETKIPELFNSSVEQNLDNTELSPSPIDL
ncbi:MAG: hypothetical protein ACFBSE_26565 [Prochloraceae cyanobacterium]